MSARDPSESLGCKDAVAMVPASHRREIERAIDKVKRSGVQRRRHCVRYRALLRRIRMAKYLARAA